MLDDLDVKILIEFSKLKISEETSTWKIMKKIYKDGKNKENLDIKYKIIKMAKKFGFFKINGEKIKIYTLNTDKVFYKNFNFPCGKKKGIAVLLNGKWEIYEV